MSSDTQHTTTQNRRGDSVFAENEQSSRFIEITGEWFFFTREKELLGPYPSRVIVEHAAQIYGKKKRLQSNRHLDNDFDDKPVHKHYSHEEKLACKVLDFEHPEWDL
jgi:hypothetical protein